VDLAGRPATALELAAAFEEKVVTAVAALPRVKAEAIIDEPLQQTAPLHAGCALALASRARGVDDCFFGHGGSRQTE
jgi:hypothetical protein